MQKRMKPTGITGWTFLDIDDTGLRMTMTTTAFAIITSIYPWKGGLRAAMTSGNVSLRQGKTMVGVQWALLFKYIF